MLVGVVVKAPVYTCDILIIVDYERFVECLPHGDPGTTGVEDD